MELRLASRGVGELVPYARNSKLHGEGDISAIMASIRRFGFNDPIGITPEGVIVEGHGRLEAARRLGMTEVPVLIIDGLTERQYDLYRIAHNKIALSTGFDFAILVDTLREVTSADIQVSDMGFSMAAFNELCQVYGENAGTERRSGRVGSGRSTNRNYAYDVIFDTPEDKRTVTAFLRSLKARYPSSEDGSIIVAYAREVCPDFAAPTEEEGEEQTNV